MENPALLRVASFNLKSDFLFSFRRAHRWISRCEPAARFIRESGASIVGVQELSPKMRQDMERLLAQGYDIVGDGRFSGRGRSDEHSDIILKTSDAQAAHVNTFWLSKKPDKPSRAYYAFFPRICTFAEVHLSAFGRNVRVFNTHLDHVSGLARALGVRVILEKIKQLNEEKALPIILMGDFNCKPHSLPIRILADSGLRLTDVYTRLDPGQMSNTFHRFSGRVQSDGLPIDYIFVSDEFEIVETKIVTEPVTGIYPSDHYPLVATLRLAATV